MDCLFSSPFTTVFILRKGRGALKQLHCKYVQGKSLHHKQLYFQQYLFISYRQFGQSTSALVAIYCTTMRQMPNGQWKYRGNHYTTKSCIFGNQYIQIYSVHLPLICNSNTLILSALLVKMGFRDNKGQRGKLWMTEWFRPSLVCCI